VSETKEEIQEITRWVRKMIEEERIEEEQEREREEQRNA
jgi:hypothetical protein